MKNSKQEPNKKKITSKQIIAIVGVIVLALLYVVTLVLAFFDGPMARHLFQISLFASLGMPLVIWLYIWMYGKITQKHTMADLDIGGHQREEDNQL